MKLEELMKLAKTDIIAYDAMTGHKLFNTRNNNKNYVQKFTKGELCAIWSDMANIGDTWSNRYIPIIKCYIFHDSWKEG